MKALTTINRFMAIGLVAACFGCNSVPEGQPKDEAGLDDPLVIALLHKDYSRATRLLKRGYPVRGRSIFNQAPAYWAITEGDLEALRLLIRFGLDVNHEWGKKGGNLLTNAVQLGHLDQVRLLVEAGASLVRDPRYGRSPLYSAVIYDQKAIEDYLRARGAQFNDWDLDAFKVLGLKTQ
jgi:ankyrin repeat protein